MSAFARVTTAYRSTADVAGGCAGGPLLTQRGHAASDELSLSLSGRQCLVLDDLDCLTPEIRSQVVQFERGESSRGKVFQELSTYGSIRTPARGAWEHTMTDFNWTEFFQSHPTFGRLGKDANFLRSLEHGLHDGSFKEKTYGKDELIIKQGEFAETLYFIGEGIAKVSVLGPDREPVDLGTLKEGDFFGEAALLDHSERLRSATVQPKDRCVVLEVNAAALADALKQHPEVFSKMLMVLGQRMHNLAHRLAEVAYTEVNNKVQLLGAKVDAELKAMNTSLSVYQTVFDQTSARTNEVLTSGEKFWNRATWATSMVGGGIMAILAVAGFVGFRSIDQLSTKTEQVMTKMDSQAKQIADRMTEELTKVELVKSQVNDAKFEAVEAAAELEKLSDAQNVSVAITTLPALIDASDGSNIDRLTAKTLFRYVLGQHNRELSQRVFYSVYYGIARKLKYYGPVNEERQRFIGYRLILAEAIDNTNKKREDDEKIVSPGDVAISYYLYLVTLALDRNKEYEFVIEDFNQYMNLNHPVLSKQFQKRLNPRNLTNGFKNNEQIPSDVRAGMTEQIESAWKLLINWSN